jgi:hypothetical protein
VVEVYSFELDYQIDNSGSSKPDAYEKDPAKVLTPIKVDGRRKEYKLID